MSRESPMKMNRLIPMLPVRNMPTSVEYYHVLYLYPDDVAEYHRHLRKNGLDIPGPDTTFYGMTEFRIEDPDGNRLWIGQRRAGAGQG